MPKMSILPIPKTVGEPLSSPYTMDTAKPTKPLTNVVDKVIKQDQAQGKSKRHRLAFHKPGDQMAFQHQNKPNRSGGVTV